MTKEQVTEMVFGLKLVYPKFYSHNTDGEMQILLKIWSTFFQDDSYEDVSKAIHYLIATSPYPPTIYDVRKALVKSKNIDKIDATQAWSEVEKAVTIYGSSKAEEALASMSEETREIVKSIGFKNICKSENLSVERGQFRMMFEAREEQELEKALIPKNFNLRNRLNTEKDSKNNNLEVNDYKNCNKNNNYEKSENLILSEEEKEEKLLELNKLKNILKKSVKAH